MIGERLLELRKDAGLAQDDLAAILNINKHSISSCERDKSEPPDVIKVAIARYFDVSVDYLLGVTDDPAPVTPQAPVLRLPAAFPGKPCRSCWTTLPASSTAISAADPCTAMRPADRSAWSAGCVASSKKRGGARRLPRAKLTCYPSADNSCWA